MCASTTYAVSTVLVSRATKRGKVGTALLGPLVRSCLRTTLFATLECQMPRLTPLCMHGMSTFAQPLRVSDGKDASRPLSVEILESPGGRLDAFGFSM